MASCLGVSLLVACAVFSVAYGWGKVSAKPGNTAACNYEGPASVQASINMNGIRGVIQFYQEAVTEPVLITVDLEGLDQFNGPLTWHIHDYPIVYSQMEDNACNLVGGHYDPLNRAENGSYTQLCMADPSFCEVGDLSGRLGNLPNRQRYQNVFEDAELTLFGPYSSIGRSVVLHRAADGVRVACANLGLQGTGCVLEDILRADFGQDSVISGSVVIRKAQGTAYVIVYADLYSTMTGNYNWNLRIRPSGDEHEQVYGTYVNTGHEGDPECGILRQRHCDIGDLTSKCGQLSFETYENGARARLLCTDTQLGVIPYSAIGELQVTIEDPNRNGEFVGSANLEVISPAAGMAVMSGIFPDVLALFYQHSPFDLTYVRIAAMSLWGRATHFEIHEDALVSGVCLPGMPYQTPGELVLEPGTTGDTYSTGDLLYLTGDLTGKQRVDISEVTSHLPLYGPCSIIGRSLFVYSGEKAIGCADIESYSVTNINRNSFTGF